MIHISQVSKNNVPLYEEVKPVRRYLKFEKRKGAVLGASLCKINRRFYITDVRSNSLAWRLGLDHGDRIDEINDKPMSSLGPLDFLELFRNVEAVELLVCSRPLELKITLRETLSPQAIRRVLCVDALRRSQSLATPQRAQLYSGGNSVGGEMRSEHQPRRTGTSIPQISTRGIEFDECGSSIICRGGSSLADSSIDRRGADTNDSDLVGGAVHGKSTAPPSTRENDSPPPYTSQAAHERSTSRKSGARRMISEQCRFTREGCINTNGSGSNRDENDALSSSTNPSGRTIAPQNTALREGRHTNTEVTPSIGTRSETAVGLVNTNSRSTELSSSTHYTQTGTIGGQRTAHNPPEEHPDDERPRRNTQQSRLPARVLTRSQLHTHTQLTQPTQLDRGGRRLLHPRAMSDRTAHQAVREVDAEESEAHSDPPSTLSWWQGCINWLVCKSVIMEPICAESEPLLSDYARESDGGGVPTGAHVCRDRCMRSCSHSDGEGEVVHVQRRGVSSGNLKYDARKYNDDNTDSFDTVDEEDQDSEGACTPPPPLPTPRLGVIYINGQVVEVEELRANDCKARPCAPPRTGDVIHEVNGKDMLGKTDAHIMLEMCIAMLQDRQVEVKFFPPVLAQEIAVARLTRKR